MQYLAASGGGGQVYLNAATPQLATVFDKLTPAVTDYPAFHNNPAFQLVGTDGSEWYWDVATGSYLPLGIAQSFASVVFVGTVSPATATVFDLENPPVLHKPALMLQDNALYIGTDGSTWVSDGASYATYVVPASTEWNFFTTTTDAGSDKTSAIERYGVAIIIAEPTANAMYSMRAYGAGYAKLDGTVASGSRAAPTYPLAGRIITMLSSRAVQNNNSTAVLYSITSAAWTIASQPTKWVMGTAQVNGIATIDRWTWTDQGYYGVNTLVPLSHIDVNGSVGQSYINTAAATYNTTSTDSIIYLTATTTQTITAWGNSQWNRRILTIVNATTATKAAPSYFNNLGVATTVIPASSTVIVQYDGTNWRQINDTTQPNGQVVSTVASVPSTIAAGVFVSSIAGVLNVDGIQMDVRSAGVFYSPVLRNLTGSTVNISYVTHTAFTNQVEQVVNATVLANGILEVEQDNRVYWDTATHEVATTRFCVNNTRWYEAKWQCYQVALVKYCFLSLARCSGSGTIAVTPVNGSFSRSHSGAATFTVGAVATDITAIIGGLASTAQGNPPIFYSTVGARFLVDPNTFDYFTFDILWRMSGTVLGGTGVSSEYVMYLTRGDGVTVLPVRKTFIKPAGSSGTFTTESWMTLVAQVFAGGADNFQLTGVTGGFKIWVQKLSGNDIAVSGTQTFLMLR